MCLTCLKLRSDTPANPARYVGETEKAGEVERRSRGGIVHRDELQRESEPVGQSAKVGHMV